MSRYWCEHTKYIESNNYLCSIHTNTDFYRKIMYSTLMCFHMFWTRRIFITNCTLRLQILSHIIKQTNKKRQLLPLAKLKLFSWFHYSNSFCWSIQILITFSSKMPIWWKQRQPFQYKLYIYIFSIFYKINGSKTIIFIYPKIIK